MESAKPPSGQPFHVRVWLARQTQPPTLGLRLRSDSTHGEQRELRYLLSGVGIVVVLIEPDDGAAALRVRATWLGGTAATNVSIDAAIVP